MLIVLCVFQEQYTGVQVIMKKTLRLLKSLARGNEPIQQRIYERLDTLLKIKGVEADLAIALKEVGFSSQVTVFLPGEFSGFEACTSLSQLG